MFVFTETGFETVFELRRLILGVLGVVFLQVLGANIEPCFEGAAFFALYQDLKKMVD